MSTARSRTLAERGQEVGERQAVHQGWLEADGRRDVRQHVVPGEEQPAGRLEEREVPTRVPGCLDGDELARARAKGLPVRRPCVGHLPAPLVVAQCRGVPAELGDELVGAAAMETGHPRTPAVARRVGEDVLERGALAPAEEDAGARRVAHRGRLAEVVTVHVGDQHAAHVAHLGAHLAQPGGERLPRGRPAPTGVHQRDAAGLLERVHVHRSQPVAGQWQRDAEDPGRHLVRARFLPAAVDGAAAVIRGRGSTWPRGRRAGR